MDVLVVVAALGFLGIGEAGRLPDGDLGTGAIAGGAGRSWTVRQEAPDDGLTLGSLVLGGSVALVGLLPTVAVALPAPFLFRQPDALVDVAASTLLQRLAPDHVLSRVFG